MLQQGSLLPRAGFGFRFDIKPHLDEVVAERKVLRLIDLYDPEEPRPAAPPGTPRTTTRRRQGRRKHHRDGARREKTNGNHANFNVPKEHSFGGKSSFCIPKIKNEEKQTKKMSYVGKVNNRIKKKQYSLGPTQTVLQKSRRIRTTANVVKTEKNE